MLVRGKFAPNRYDNWQSTFENSPMLITRREAPILVFSLAYIAGFTALAVRRTNYEFVLYSCVVVTAIVVMLVLNSHMRFSRSLLWGMSAWGLLHMAGGNVSIAEGRVLYELQLFPRVLRYDQFVHAFGFGLSTVVCYRVLCMYLVPDVRRWWPLATLVVLMGSGVGAMNEIVEFAAVMTVPETKVGGYENTMWDLVFNLLGGLIAVVAISLTRSVPCNAAEESSRTERTAPRIKRRV